MADQTIAQQTRLFTRLKTLIHQQVITTVNLDQLALMSDEELRHVLRPFLQRLTRERQLDLSLDDQEILVQEIVDEIYGYGPLQQLMQDPDISDILVNGCQNVFVERHGVLHVTDVRFPDDESVLAFIERLVNRMGRRIDEASPMVDAQLPDGSRLHAVIPPLSLRGPTLSIRRFKDKPLLLEDLVGLGSLTTEMADFLAKAVRARANLIISGGTGVGKTTLLNSLSRFIPRSERVITIENTAELQLQQPDVVSLEARPPNIEGRGEVKVRELMRNALRMRPDRIIVGECRGDEVFDVLQAMMTGHDGSMSTIHAGDPREAIKRMELMIALSGIELPKEAARYYVAAAVQLIVHMKRLSNGERKIVRITELQPREDDRFDLVDLFTYEQRVGGEGKLRGQFLALGHTPRLLERMHTAGIDLSPELFAARELDMARLPKPA